MQMTRNSSKIFVCTTITNTTNILIYCSVGMGPKKITVNMEIRLGNHQLDGSISSHFNI